MITKFTRIGLLIGIIVLCLPMVLSSLAPGLAQATGEQYLFYYDPKDASAVQQAFSGNPLGASGLEDNFDKTTVYAKGGVFGGTPVAFTYDQAASSLTGGGGNGGLGSSAGGSDSLQYDSTTALSCKVTQLPPGAPGLINPPYTLSIVLALTANVTAANIHNNSPVSSILSLDDSNTQVTYNGNTSSLSDLEGQYDASIKDFVPQNCVPAGLDLGSNSGSPQLKNYAGLSKTAKKSWPGVQSSATIIQASIAAPNGSATGTASTDLSCDGSFGNSGLSWILCPIVNYIFVPIISVYDGAITDQLNIKTNAIFCTTSDTCKAYYAAWQTFRDIALGLMAAVGLIIVISQALGMEILDAYTIRKVLPRLLVAAIAIVLSWPLMRFMINLSDDLAFGIRYLIYAPFANLPDKIDLSFGGGVTNFFFGAAAGGGAIIAAIPLWVEFGGLGALILFAFTAALAVAVAIAVLILRQVLVILMMLLAPLAIIAYVLPNTQRIYRLWWESFSKALLMFPLIAALIATGRVFSAITFANGGFFNQLIGFVAYFAPYFMVPATFRMAGGALSAMGNFINSRAHGGFAALSKQRGEVRGARHKAARVGGLYRHGFGKFSYWSPLRAKDASGKRTGSHVRQTSVDKMLNAITNNTIDAQDGWRINAAKRGGKVGQALFGRQARDLEDRIERQKIEHTANAAKVLQGRYHTARAVGGAFGYYYNGLDTGGKQALRDEFGIGQRDNDGHLSEANWQAAGGKFRGTENEKEDQKAASILETGDQGAREAAAELRASAITLSTFKGAGKEETQRFDRNIWSMMVRGQAGRLENSEIADYFNQRSDAVGQEKAYLETKQVQNLAAPKRTSQAEGYGLHYETKPEVRGGRVVGVTRAVDVYEDPAGGAAQKSFNRTSTADLFNGKSEDFVDPEGDISGWGQTIIAASSDYNMRTIKRTRKDPQTGKTMYRLDPKTHERKPVYVMDPRTGKPKTMVISTGVLKDKQGLLNAQAARSKIQSGEGYAQGDTGVGGQIYRLMQRAQIDTKYGYASRSEDTAIQREAGYIGTNPGTKLHDPNAGGSSARRQHDEQAPQFAPNAAEPQPQEPPK